MLAALVVAAGAFVAVVLLGGAGHTHGGSGPGGGSSSGGSALQLTGLTTYDPQGDGTEAALGQSTARFATDRNLATYWRTEIYNTQDWGNLKSGLGLVLDARRSAKLSQLTVEATTAGSGFVAQIEVGNSPDSFAVDSASQTVGSKTTFTLQGKSGRYWMVWLSRLGPARTAQIAEVTARS